MQTPYLILKTSVKSSLKRSVLFRGTLLASLGGLLILFGSFFSKGVLTSWGLPLYLIGIYLISLGLLPHRKLLLLETSPNEIHINSVLILIFKVKGTTLFSVPCVSLTKMSYIEKGSDYGIAFWFSNSSFKNVLIYSHKVKLDDLQSESKKKYGCDIFLPYFSKRSYTEMVEFLIAETTNAESSENQL
jgi:hypothetical protein